VIVIVESPPAWEELPSFFSRLAYWDDEHTVLLRHVTIHDGAVSFSEHGERVQSRSAFLDVASDHLTQWHRFVRHTWSVEIAKLANLLLGYRFAYELESSSNELEFKADFDGEEVVLKYDVGEDTVTQHAHAAFEVPWHGFDVYMALRWSFIEELMKVTV
jgi:hypothetical protein